MRGWRFAAFLSVCSAAHDIGAQATVGEVLVKGDHEPGAKGVVSVDEFELSPTKALVVGFSDIKPVIDHVGDEDRHHELGIGDWFGRRIAGVMFHGVRELSVFFHIFTGDNANRVHLNRLTREKRKTTEGVAVGASQFVRHRRYFVVNECRE
jgi:hypothetical protein